jgi:hypothetical protein
MEPRIIGAGLMTQQTLPRRFIPSFHGSALFSGSNVKFTRETILVKSCKSLIIK